MALRFALACWTAAALVTACAAFEPAPDPPVDVLEIVAAVASEPPPEPKPCGKVKRAWLKQKRPAEGSILIVFEVSSARRRQVNQLSDQLALIEAALKKHGCVEIER